MSVATSNGVHLAASSNNGVLIHNPEIAGVSGIAGPNDTTSSDVNSAKATAKGPQPKAVQVTVAGTVRFSNPS